MKNLRQRIIRGALAGGLARLVTMAVGLGMTPYILARLGPSQFGLWSLATVVGASYGLLDLGFRSAIVKHLAEGYAKNDTHQIEQIILSCLLLYSTLATLALAIYYFIGKQVINLLGVPNELRSLAFSVFLVVLCTAAMSSILSVIPSILDANNRMAQTQTLGVLCLLVGAALTIYLIESGRGLMGLAVSQLASSAAFFAASTWLARGKLSVRFVHPGSFSAGTARRLFQYGSRLYVSTLCDIVNRQFDKVLFARLGGLPLVASYEIAGRMVGNVGSLQGNLWAPLLPASSRLSAAGSHGQLRRLYLTASRYAFLIGIPPFFLLVLLAPDVVLAWLGQSDPTAALILRILCAGFLFNSMSHVMAATCQGVGAVEIQAKQSVIQLCSNITLSLGLVLPLGIWGPPLGTSLALLLGAIYFAATFHPHIGIKSGKFLYQTLVPPLAAATVALAASLPLLASGGLGSATTRVEALAKVSLTTCLFFAVYGLLCWQFGLIRQGEIAEFREALFSAEPAPE